MKVSTTTLQISGYQGEPVPNTFFQHGGATDHIAIVLPGVRYTCPMPLLYYPTRLLLSMGADVLWVEYTYDQRPGFWALSEAERERWFITDV
ncbi:MAG: hypothetical protein C4309_13855, partial [Chloroflexota bacterium]